MKEATEPTIRKRVGGRTPSGERWLRRVAAATLLYLQFQGMLGLAWDIEWHRSVGRDAFLTPPHILLYTSVAISGMVCLGMVLLETMRYRRGVGVHDGNSVRVLSLFHAPLGFVVIGFGNLTTALAAPLDNYWHHLYGIDVTLWAPFHMMGLLGGIIAGLGSIYVWSALLVEARQRDGAVSWRQPETWALLLVLMLALGQMVTMTRPALLQFPTADLGALYVMTYPVLLALGAPWLFVAASRITGKLGAASVVVLFLMARDVLLQLFVPWAVRTGAAAEGLPFRDPSRVPSFSFEPLLLDLGLLAVAIVVDFLIWRSQTKDDRGWLLPVTVGTGSSAVLYIVAVLFANRAATLAAGTVLPAGIHLGTPADWAATLLALPIALGFGALSGLFGNSLAQVWRRNPR